MKKLHIITLLIALFSMVLTQAQDLVKYDYLEIIVIQKMNNSGKIKRIKVEEQPSLTGKLITIKEIEALNANEEKKAEFILEDTNVDKVDKDDKDDKDNKDDKYDRDGKE